MTDGTYKVDGKHAVVRDGRLVLLCDELERCAVRLTLDDGTSFGNPTDERVSEALWMLHHGHELTQTDRYLLSALLSDYISLVRHPLGVEHAIRKFRMLVRASRRSDG